MSEPYLRHTNIACLICGKPIYRRPGVLKANKGKTYCSSYCYGVACRKEHPCKICGKPIMTRLNKVTCSRACANINRAGIKYTGRRVKDKVVALRALRSRLIDNRGNICERCGYNKSNILQIHHKDRNRSNNNLNNLELLCPNCHTEKYYLINKQ